MRRTLSKPGPGQHAIAAEMAEIYRAPSPHADSIAAILKVLREGKRFLVCSHTRPDGDAVGSCLALGILLDQMGKHAVLVTPDRIPAVYRKLPGAERIQTRVSVHGQFDAAILLECDSVERTRLHGLYDLFLINIDHHVTGKAFAQLNWIDRHAVSVGELVYRLAMAAGSKLTPEMATCLYTTIFTDTGGFCYGAIKESTFALARDLVAAGANPVAIAHDVYFSIPASRLVLMGAAIRRLKREGRIAWLWVTEEEIQQSHAAEEDCEGIVNVALGIAGVDVAVFLRELPEGLVRLSLRSTGEVNVAAIAARLGGGGHENAAGCTVEGPISGALKQILSRLRRATARLAAAAG